MQNLYSSAYQHAHTHTRTHAHTHTRTHARARAHTHTHTHTHTHIGYNTHTHTHTQTHTHTHTHTHTQRHTHTHTQRHTHTPSPSAHTSAHKTRLTMGCLYHYAPVKTAACPNHKTRREQVVFVGNHWRDIPVDLRHTANDNSQPPVSQGDTTHFRSVPLFPSSPVGARSAHPHHLVSLVVRRPPRERKSPGSNPALAGIFSGSSHTNWHSSGYPARRLAL